MSNPKKHSPTAYKGRAQLSLVEHALCPLAARKGAVVGQIHESHYRYTHGSSERRTARVRVICPLGLTPNDEFFLWGLLALTLSQPEPIAEFHVTPHYSIGARYYNISNSLNAEGKSVTDAAAAQQTLFPARIERR